MKDSADGVPKNTRRAVNLLRKVIDENGDSDAIVLLAMILEKGDEGVEKDAVEALLLYRRAVGLGNPEAQQLLEGFVETEPSGNTSRISVLSPRTSYE